VEEPPKKQRKMKEEKRGWGRAFLRWRVAVKLKYLKKLQPQWPEILGSRFDMSSTHFWFHEKK
jgi:hypothetical protein